MSPAEEWGAEQPARTGLPSEAMAYLTPDGRAVAYHGGELIVRRGDPGRAFYVVLSGQVEVRLAAPDGRGLRLRRLGAGEFFGEMSVLTGDPVSADVVAVGPAAVLAYPADRLSLAMAECEALRQQVTATLARNLRQLSEEVWLEHHRAEALSLLVETRVAAGPIAADSRPMRRVVEQIDRLSRDPGPVLITGEPGTGKLFAAGRIAKGGRDKAALLVVVDCRGLRGSDASRYLFGAPSLPGPGSAPDAPVPGRGAAHLARSGTLVLRHVDALGPAAQDALLRHLEAREAEDREDGPGPACPRLVATTRLSLDSLVASAEFSPGLAQRFGRAVLALPTLAERRKDILPLAGLFLREAQGAGAARFSRGAQHALLSRHYGHRNAAELREAVEMAAFLAGGGEVLQEHVLTGCRREGSPAEVDVARLPGLRWLLHERVLAWARLGVLGLFSAVTLACLAAPGTGPGQLAGYLLWGLGVPALAATLLPFGRLFCTVCPLSTGGRLAARVRSLGRPPPAWADRHFPWVVAAGVAVAAWAVLGFGLPLSPRGSGVLLLLLAAGSAAASVVYRGQAWCRYLCPVGALGALYAPTAALRVAADAHVCDAFCTTHECHRGSAELSGCPTYHHPLYEGEGQACKLCLECLRLCPHGSASLRLRPPFFPRSSGEGTSGPLSLLALTVFLLAPVLLLAHAAGGSASPRFPLLVLGAAGLALGARFVLPGLLSPEAWSGRQALSRLSLPLAILAWGPGFASQIADARLLALAELRLGSGALEGMLQRPIAVPLGLVLQVAALATSAACFLAVVAQVRSEFMRESLPLRGWVWKGVTGAGLAYLALALFLLR